MKHLHGVEALKDRLVLRYSDDADPSWVWGREIEIAWKAHPNVSRLVAVACHIFELLITRPDLVESNDELLQEWLGQCFQARPRNGQEDSGNTS